MGGGNPFGGMGGMGGGAGGMPDIGSLLNDPVRLIIKLKLNVTNFTNYSMNIFNLFQLGGASCVPGILRSFHQDYRCNFFLVYCFT